MKKLNFERSNKTILGKSNNGFQFIHFLDSNEEYSKDNIFTN